MSEHTWRELERADMDTAAAHCFDEERMAAMTGTTELLPCPFCGGEADEYEGDYGNGIYCMMCGAMVGEPIHLEYRTTKRVSIAEAIEAWNSRAEHGTLTAEQVREAIFNGSSYASYDGAKYYADGISMQAIADELNACAERTCRIEGRYGNQYCTCCGEMVGTWDSTSELYIDGNMVELWNYCPNCGARVTPKNAETTPKVVS